MSLVYLSVAALIFIISMVLYSQWLVADRKGKTRQYKKRRWISIWICYAVVAALILFFVQTD